MKNNQKNTRLIEPIELPGLENKLYANKVRNYIEIIHHDLTDAEQVYDAILRLREYGEQHGLEYITFHPRTCDPYYPALMDMLNETFRIEHYQTVGVHEFFRLTWNRS